MIAFSWPKNEIISFENIALDQAFWDNRLTNAMRHRKGIGLPGEKTDCFRLVHGEGDGLPGLVVDIYGSTAVMQCHSIGMHREREQIAMAIRNALPQVTSIYDKSANALPERYAATIEDGYLFGLDNLVDIFQTI